MNQVSLNYEASAGDTHKQVVTSLPPEVVQCLDNARFLHLATCTDNQPHVALMNYTYLPASPISSDFTSNSSGSPLNLSGPPVIIMTTNLASKKTNNLVANPNVSLLVHDWVSHRPPTQGRRPSGGSPGPEQHSSLAAMLARLNSSAVSSISATINGTASLSRRGSEEESFYLKKHLENNTFDGDDPDGGGSLSQQGGEAGEGGGREQLVADEDVGVIVVTIRDIRTSDWKGGVKDWVLVPEGSGTNGNAAAVNGIR